jgi:hypothetical protein
MTLAYDSCPYNELPPQAFFRNLGDLDRDILLQPDRILSIGPADKIISAGSCFAAKIAESCRESGLTYLFSDDRCSSDPNEIQEESHAFFSLRYGNIYTTRHLTQLLRRATGKVVIQPPISVDKNGRYRNLSRPSTLSYSSIDLVREDDDAHLSNIRKLLERATVFAFTLGLTEQWIDSETGITFPSAPGCGFGEFDASRHFFHNATFFEVVEELRESIALLREINPNLSIIFTLSPVPLVATYTGASAIEATFYSKSLLRQAIAEVVSKPMSGDPPTLYFPSYEIVTNPFRVTENFSSDMRSVTKLGVNRVMEQFREWFVSKAVSEPRVSVITPDQPESLAVMADDMTITRDAEPECDEENIWKAYLHNHDVD